MVSKTVKTQRRKEARGKDYVPQAAKPKRDVPKAKHDMKSKRKYRLLGLAPTPGVYEGFDDKGKEVYDCKKCGKVCKVKDFCVKCAIQDNQKMKS